MCHILCWNIAYSLLDLGKITFSAKKTVVLAEKAVKSRRKKKLHNEFVNPIKLHRIRLQKKNPLNIIKSLKAFLDNGPRTCNS